MHLIDKFRLVQIILCNPPLCALLQDLFQHVTRRQRGQQWRRRDVAPELVEGGEATRLTDSDAFPAVLLDRRAGTIQPLAYVRGPSPTWPRKGAKKRRP